MEIINKRMSKALVLLISLFCISNYSFASNNTVIKGRLISKDKDKLSTYVVKNNRNGLIANAKTNGTFEIEAMIGDTLTVSKNDTVKNTSTVKLDSYVEILLNKSKGNNKVNVAYGVQDLKEVVGAVDYITSERIENKAVTNSHHITQGQLAGLTTIQKNGEPGSNGLDFLIRGKGTFNNNEPLVLIDGFEANFAQLSRTEIESITVLKDAVATAMYGMRGANGVILVNTKSGAKGKTKYNVEMEYGVLQPVELPKFVDAYNYASLVNQTLQSEGLGDRYSSEQLQAYKAGNDPYNNPNINWVDEMLNKSTNYYNGNVSVKGGGEQAAFYVAANYMYADGLLNHTDQNTRYNTATNFGRFNLRSKVDIKVNKTTDFRVNLAGRIEDRHDPEVGVSSFLNKLYATPANRYVMFNEPNEEGEVTYGGTDKYQDNPMALLGGKGYDEQHNRTFTVNLHLKHRLDYLLKGLSVGMETSFNNYFSTTEKFKASYAVYDKQLGIDGDGNEYVYYNQYGTVTPIQYNKRTTSQDNHSIFRGYIELKKSLNDHSLYMKALYQGEELVNKNDGESYRYRGLSGRVKYGYKGKYFAEFVASYNGNNAYKPGNQFGFFPAFGAGWVVSEEDFLSGISAIDFLKLRASYGKTGNDLLNGYRRFMYLSLYNGGGDGDKSYFGTKPDETSNLRESDIANPDAKWEDAYQANIGLDLKLYKNINFSFDFFKEKRIDILQSIDNVTSSMIGINLPQLNYGEVENKGFEITLGYQNQVSNDLFVGISGNLGFARSEITKRYEGVNTSYTQIGSPVGQEYGFIADGFYTTSNIAQGPISSYEQVQPGDVRYKDLSGPNGTSDGIIDDYDKTAIGYQRAPEIHYGINIDLAYKNIYANALFDGNANRSLMLNDNIVYRPLQNGYDNISVYAMDNYWTPERGNSAQLPRLTTKDNYNNYKGSTLYQKNGNFVRLRSLELGYKLPSAWTDALNISMTKLFFRGYNLLSIDNVDGVDPEVTSGYPLLKSYNVGINVQF